MLTCQWIEMGPVAEIFVHGTWASQPHRSFRCVVNSRAKAVPGHRKLWIIIRAFFSDFGGPKPGLWRWTLQTGLDMIGQHFHRFSITFHVLPGLSNFPRALTIRCSEHAKFCQKGCMHLQGSRCGPATANLDRNNCKRHQPMWRCMRRPEAQRKGDFDWAPLLYIMQRLLCEPAEGFIWVCFPTKLLFRIRFNPFFVVQVHAPVTSCSQLQFLSHKTS